MDVLLNKRRAIKGQLTRLEAVSAGHTTQPLADIAVKTYQEKADKLMTDLELLQMSIVALCTTANFDAHEKEYNELILRAEDLSMFFNVLLSQRKKASQQPAQTTADIRLPKMELPSFSGNYTDWFTFHDLFTATVHNSSLSGAQKLQYLKSSLRGEAALLIQSILITDANYDEAWNILLNRYNNTREVIDAHIKRLFHQPGIKEESASAIRNLIDTTTECIRSLRVLNEPVKYWDAILIHVVKEKLDSETRKQWELSLTSSIRPTFKELTTFLEQRARALLASSSNPSKPKPVITSYPRKNTIVHHGAVSDACTICGGQHPIYKCETLLKASVDERWRIIKEHSLCYNCLRGDHQLSKCKSSSCRKCSSKHNTLLHRDTKSSDESSSGSNRVLTMVSREAASFSQVILATAIIQVELSDGRTQSIRALLDSGSQASFITERCCKQLQVKRRRLNVTIGGIGAVGVGTSRGSVQIKVKPSDGSGTINVDALVLKTVTEDLPNLPINIKSWSHIKKLKLADITFYKPGPIDVLLGADVYLQLIRDGIRKGRPGTAGAFNTAFGWVICGPTGLTKSNDQNPAIQVHPCTIDEQLAKFWELEEICPKRTLTVAELQCEESFSKFTTRNDEGRYVVRLPFKGQPELGDSRRMAVRRFTNQEKRLQSNSNLYDQYRAFMAEYIKLGHMAPVSSEEQAAHKGFYLPHHAVLKESSNTTKLRVVFDASAKSTNGSSLNDLLLTGAKIQDDLISLLIRFRFHAVVMTADIEKMYRQILVHHEDTNLQRIVWRSNPSEPLRDYKLLTVTYGTAAAPFLATRTLKQLATDVQHKYPDASKALSEDFYVDDLMTGKEDTTHALELQSELLKASTESGFQLQKWASNDPALLSSLSPEMREIHGRLNLDNTECIKTLGLLWTPASDSFSFAVTVTKEQSVITKRTILSEVAKVFDPLGLLAPVIVKTKILLQDLWRFKLDWDDQLPDSVITKWKSFQSDLLEIKHINIQRHISQRQVQEISLQGFSDASEKAYGAAVYLRTKTQDDQIQTHLIAAKTKVAPLKQISLPKLELCGAVLLIRLVKIIHESLKNRVAETHCWTDSMTVLGWLSSPPQRWKTFIANRVSEIQGSVKGVQWHHVKGEQNPADCASRGISASELQNHSLWWHGPCWLNQSMTFDDQSTLSETEECLIEARPISTISTHGKIDTTLLDKYSSLTTLLRVTAYIHRFGKNARTPKPDRTVGPLSTSEVESALKHWVKTVQQQEFAEEIHALQTTKPIPSRSKLLSLTPFLDSDGLLRVGGRIRNAKINTDRLHPMIIPRRSKLTDLIIVYEHLKHLHAGPQLLASAIQRRFWICGLRDAVRFQLRRCVPCVRQRATTLQQQMADLPAVRVNPARAFLRCGVDYAGPFSLKVMKIRGQKTFKAYIALFVCFVTRAIHLEIVSDMTTDAFLAALKRFTARRGKSSDIYSDCGSNFQGASRELRDFLKFTTTQSSRSTISRWTSEEGIRWHFNPPAAPNFGGLWEAGVKSVKFHLKRVVGLTALTFEEMNTLLCQVEACLNSRPLSAMSTDPDSLAALTPGHFLIGDALTAIPEPDLTSTKINRLTRWQLGQQLLQHFWRRWHNEYLTRLQQRPKWLTTKRNLQVDDLVLLKEDDLPPTKWKLGRIQEVHPGTDNCVRVATIRTADNVIKRPVSKICLLPLDQ